VTITTETVQQYIGTTLFDDAGHKIGKIGAVFLDDITSDPEWLTVSTGFFGTNESFVPAAGASAREDGLTVPYSKDKIKHAPNVDVDHGHLSTDEEANLYRYYGLDYGNSRTESTQGQAGVSPDPVGVSPAPAPAHDQDHTHDQGQAHDAGQAHPHGKHADTSAGVDAGPATGTGSGKHADPVTPADAPRDQQSAPSGKARLRRWVDSKPPQSESAQSAPQSGPHADVERH
jgi:hypothetical protein